MKPWEINEGANQLQSNWIMKHVQGVEWPTLSLGLKSFSPVWHHLKTCRALSTLMNKLGIITAVFITLIIPFY